MHLFACLACMRRSQEGGTKILSLWIWHFEVYIGTPAFFENHKPTQPKSTAMLNASFHFLFRLGLPYGYSEPQTLNLSNSEGDKPGVFAALSAGLGTPSFGLRV